MALFNAQEILFQRIRELIPSNESMAERVAEELHLSLDSAYRRIRGETPLVLDEAVTLCRHFGLSVDQLIKGEEGLILFRDQRIQSGKMDFSQYLAGLRSRLIQATALNGKEIIYMSKDLPVFHNFYFRPLTAFRYYFWMKTHLMHPDFERRTFDFNLLTDEIYSACTDITRLYSRIPSTEMWNTESINSTISQIEFSKDSGFFNSASDIRCIYQDLEETIRHVQLQAEHGKKFMPGEKQSMSTGDLRFFYNRVVLGDNTIMVVADSHRSAYINYGNLNYIITQDETFCNRLYDDFENLIRRSTLISQSGEKQRNIFFHIIFSKISDRIRKL